MNVVASHFHYLVFVVLLLTGCFLAFACRNLIRKVIGLYLVQTSVMLFYLSQSWKDNTTIPILEGHGVPDPALYANPLPHALMLTAIVVGVATLGVSLALIIRIHRRYRTLEEDVLLQRMAEEDAA